MMNYTIKTQKDLEKAVEAYGILPLFRNAIPGFSVEEHTVPEAWFSGEEGVWEWKGPVIRNTGCAYGKFFGNKAVFISMDWFPDFANYRRDGYDFDARFEDGLASYKDRTLYKLKIFLYAVLIFLDNILSAFTGLKDAAVCFHRLLRILLVLADIHVSLASYRPVRIAACIKMAPVLSGEDIPVFRIFQEDARRKLSQHLFDFSQR